MFPLPPASHSLLPLCPKLPLLVTKREGDVWGKDPDAQGSGSEFLFFILEQAEIRVKYGHGSESRKVKIEGRSKDRASTQTRVEAGKYV